MWLGLLWKVFCKAPEWWKIRKASCLNKLSWGRESWWIDLACWIGEARFWSWLGEARFWGRKGAANRIRKEKGSSCRRETISKYSRRIITTECCWSLTRRKERGISDLSCWNYIESSIIKTSWGNSRITRITSWRRLITNSWSAIIINWRK